MIIKLLLPKLTMFQLCLNKNRILEVVITLISFALINDFRKYDQNNLKIFEASLQYIFNTQP